MDSGPASSDWEWAVISIGVWREASSPSGLRARVLATIGGGDPAVIGVTDTTEAILAMVGDWLGDLAPGTR